LAENQGTLAENQGTLVKIQATFSKFRAQEQRRRKIGAGVRNTVIPLIKKSSRQGAKHDKNAERGHVA